MEKKSINIILWLGIGLLSVILIFTFIFFDHQIEQYKTKEKENNLMIEALNDHIKELENAINQFDSVIKQYQGAIKEYENQIKIMNDTIIKLQKQLLNAVNGI